MQISGSPAGNRCDEVRHDHQDRDHRQDRPGRDRCLGRHTNIGGEQIPYPAADGDTSGRPKRSDTPANADDCQYVMANT